MQVDKKITELFGKAREEEPRLSVEEVLKELQFGLSQSEGSSRNNISTFKLMIMISTISTLTLSAFMFVSTAGEPHANMKEIHVAKSIQENITEINNTNQITTEIPEIKSTKLPEKEPIQLPASKESKSNVNILKQAGEPNRSVEKPVFSGRKYVGTKSNAPVYGPSSNVDVGASRIFFIDNTTRTDQIEIMKLEANKAGILFEYKTRKDGSLKKLHMTISSKNSTSTHKLVIDREDNVQIGWIVNEKDNSVRFYDRDREIERISEEQKVHVDKIKMEVMDFEKKVIKASRDWLMGN